MFDLIERLTSFLPGVTMRENVDYTSYSFFEKQVVSCAVKQQHMMSEVLTAPLVTIGESGAVEMPHLHLYL